MKVVAGNGGEAGKQSFRVLASGSAEGRQLEVVEYEDGSLAITFDGEMADPLHYCWGPGRIESCVNAFMRMLRRHPAGD